MKNRSEDPLVSVLMTCYNREDYIAEAITSVMNSSYGNWELIIVDDGSNDRTVSIARDFAEKEKRIRVFENDKNLGDYPNRNKAAGYARGDYLKYLDSDDYIYPFGLESMVYFMQKYPEAGYGLGQLPPDKERPFPILLNPAEAYEYNYFRSPIFIKSPMSAIIRKSVFEETGGFPEGRMTSDYEMWHKISLRYPVLLMPQGLTWYRKHGEQEIGQKDHFTLGYLHITYQYIRSEQCPLASRKTKELLGKLSNYRIRLIFQFMMKGKFKSVADILRI
jgi:glycosyltransferase involved in cell wall biosynthesis